MKNLKFAVAAFGALGLVALLMMKLIPDGFKHDFVNALLVTLGFVAPLAMGIMGITKAPFQRWQGAVSIAGFGLVFVKLEMYDHFIDRIKAFGDAPTEYKLLLIAVLLGLVTSIIATVKPEEG